MADLALLRDAGILMDAPAAAAARARELHAEPLPWWDAPRTRALR